MKNANNDYQEALRRAKKKYKEKLIGKCALVTGASGGMGFSVTRLLSEVGCKVYALDKNISDELSALENVTAIVTDLTDAESVREAYSQIAKKCRRLDFILHFAGIYMLDSLVEMSEERLLFAYNVNLFGAARINREMLPLLGKGSRILITTSELAPLDPLPFTGIYALTKSALDKYAYSLRSELSLLGIDVIVLRPGAVDTGMLGVSERELDAFVARTEHYSCNAERFRGIVRSVEARRISPVKLSERALGAICAFRPRHHYSINRNPLLLLLELLPDRLACYIIAKILKD